MKISKYKQLEKRRRLEEVTNYNIYIINIAYMDCIHVLIKGKSNRVSMHHRFKQV